jgi:hypothetical protein
VDRHCAKIQAWQVSQINHNLRLMLRNTKHLRLDNLFSIVFALSVTTCSALRLKILTRNNAPVATKGNLAGSRFLQIPFSFSYNRRCIFAD